MARARTEAQRRWRQRNKKEIAGRQARRQRENPEKFRAIWTRYIQKNRAAVIAHLGGLCVRCGFSDIRALQIDHVNGDGFMDRRTRNAHTLYKAVRTDTQGRYQLLCANCNWIKMHEQREYRQMTWGKTTISTTPPPVKPTP